MTMTIEHKRGDTFSYAGTVPLPAGSWSGEAQVRRFKKLIAELTVVVTPPVGEETEYGVLLEAAPEITALWPIGTLNGDVQFTDADTGYVVSTTTFNVTVIRDETYDEP